MANHVKTADVYADNEMLATYVRLLILGVERYADRHGDSFIIHKRELCAITGRGRADVARRSLERLVYYSPITAVLQGDMWRITIPNFAKKQGFIETNRAKTERSSTTTTTTTTTKNKRLSEPPSAVGKAHTPSPLLNLLSKEPGTASEKATWLDRELPLLEELARRDHPTDPTAALHELRSRVIRHYRQHLKPPRGDNRLSPAQARAARTDQAAANVIKELSANADKSRDKSRHHPPDVPNLRSGS